MIHLKYYIRAQLGGVSSTTTSSINIRAQLTKPTLPVARTMGNPIDTKSYDGHQELSSQGRGSQPNTNYSLHSVVFYYTLCNPCEHFVLSCVLLHSMHSVCFVLNGVRFTHSELSSVASHLPLHHQSTSELSSPSPPSLSPEQWVIQLIPSLTMDTKSSAHKGSAQHRLLIALSCVLPHSMQSM